MPSTSVHHMLNELVDLSHSIAALLEQGQMLSPTGAPSAADRQQEASLKTQEIERIVRRVEAHFVDRIQSLEALNASLAEEVRQLRGALVTQRANGAAGRANVLHDISGSDLQEDSKTLDAWEKASWDETGNGAAVSEVEQLRRVLVAEKRQRLRVEEQTQSLTEQHARVVGTLERRLKKQEEQLYDLIAAIDRGYRGGSATTSASPTRCTERGSSHRLPTPRHLLRQQLAQHQQTQRALQQYKENLHLEPPSPAGSDEVAATMKELGLDDVRRTLELIRSSKPLTVQEHHHDQEETHTSPAVRLPPHTVRDGPAVVHSPTVCSQVPLPAADRAACTSANEVDEITAFLENITKELESLDSQ
ncbi:conserved hypothetical protein [Leishmania mexicana MHOM/GT/2001/U1103]|uniref:Uncharacterized protein n=1 Tax=Leishmania mexicana (strain MHOM/GT/2001/U1103) TaxID=929439 RepID=E9B2E1_LEIMU|nr:conserved hypothetical protein [Leishmania mexicana MHOM/GT/2001/U1103]CBZ29404.1 conserved hypothetical protein [Leishmania mexicana MHOM/GT/2001/U1103]